MAEPTDSGAARGGVEEGMGEFAALPAGPDGRHALQALPASVIPFPATFDAFDEASPEERHILGNAVNVLLCILLASVVIGAGVLAAISLASQAAPTSEVCAQ